MKEIFIIGGSSSSLFLTSLITYYKLDYKVTIIEKNKVLGRKLLATGNGRCNLLNKKINEFSFNNEETKSLITKEDIDFELDFFINKLGIELTNINELVYPYSFSAKSFTNFLLNYISSNKNIRFLTETIFLDYRKNNNNQYEIITSKGNYFSDYIIFASGGKSYPSLGSDGSIFNILKKHNYKITPIFPGLSPIKLKESTKEIENERIKCEVSLFNNKDELIYKENGEIIFKKDGVSGICIMNISSLILRNKLINPYIKINFLNNISLNEFINIFNIYLKNNKNNNNFLLSFYSERLAIYLYKNINKSFNNNININNIDKIYNLLTNYKFNYLSNYDFLSSQVSVGGISYSNLSINDLSSKIDKNIYFVGEILDSDGMCGGYNLMISFFTSLKVVKALSNYNKK